MENVARDTDFRHYFKEIKQLLPAYNSYEKDFMARFRADVSAYADAHPEQGSEQTIAFFGTPAAVVADYLKGADSAGLSKRVRTAKYIKTGVIVVIAIVLICGAVRSALLYNVYMEAQKSYIESKEVIIDKQEDTP